MVHTLDSVPSFLSSVGTVLLIDSAVKGVVVLALVAVITSMMGRASAAARHSLWMFAVCSLMLTPLLSTLLPNWHVVPSWMSPSATDLTKPDAGELTSSLTHEDQRGPVADSAGQYPAAQFGQQPPPVLTPLDSEAEWSNAEGTNRVQEPVSPRGGPKLEIGPIEDEVSRFTSVDYASSMLVMTWAFGASILLLRLMVSQLCLWRLQHNCERISSGRLFETMRLGARQLKLKRHVRLYMSTRNTVPMTWGIFRPAILMPTAAEQWSDDQLRCTLLHELSHVQRRDCLSGLVSQLACAAHWFNPLTWFSVWRVHIERERACDDIVLRNGVNASTYAEQLLCVASGLRPYQLAAYASVSMASSGNIRLRLKAILDEEQNRRPVGLISISLLAVLFLGVVTPLAMLNTRGESSDGRSNSASSDAVENAGPRYRALHNRYRAKIREAVNAGDKEGLDELTVAFNESIGRELAYVLVMPRVGPVTSHRIFYSRGFGDSEFDFDKKGLRVASEPHVLAKINMKNGRSCIYVETQEVAILKWPDDLQVIMIFDPVLATLPVTNIPASTVQLQSEATSADEGSNNRRPKVAASIDPKSFRLDLVYRGQSDKPFYNVSLQTGSINEKPQPFSIIESIDEYRASRIVTWLDESAFIQHARNFGPELLPDAKESYALRVTSKDKILVEDLGWDMGMLLRLDSLRRVFDEQPESNLIVPVPAPNPLDPLLSRLGGDRRIWTQGRIVNDLKTQLSSEQKTFMAGEPIPITLDVTNVGERDRTYSHGTVTRNEVEIKVFNQYGRSVPYVGGQAQILERRNTLAPGNTAAIESFDLAQFRYLRKPGEYTVAYFGPGGLSSNSFAFQVMPNPVDDGDLVGGLLPLVHNNWTLVANPNFKGKVRPGVNFEEVAGQQILFQHSPTGMKRDVALIWLWLAHEKAKPHVRLRNETHPPRSKYFGKVSRWHLYAHIDERGAKRWPNVLRDVSRALGEFVDDSADRLRPLSRDGWKFTASPANHTFRPGSNWKEATGRDVTFIYNPPITEDYSGIIKVSLMGERAEPKLPNVAIETSVTSSEYLGRIARWHVYMTASSNALQTWPTAKEDILRALRTPPPEDAISQFTEHLNETFNWNWGVSRIVKLPKTASHEEVLANAVKINFFSLGPISSYQVVRSRPVNLFLNGFPVKEQYAVVQVDSDLGKKFLLIRYTGDGCWWTRFYDVPVDAITMWR